MTGERRAAVLERTRKAMERGEKLTAADMLEIGCSSAEVPAALRTGAEMLLECGLDLCDQSREVLATVRRMEHEAEHDVQIRRYGSPETEPGREAPPEKAGGDRNAGKRRD